MDPAVFWSGVGGAVLGALVGGGLTVAGSVWAKRLELLREHRIRLHLEVIPRAGTRGKQGQEDALRDLVRTSFLLSAEELRLADAARARFVEYIAKPEPTRWDLYGSALHEMSTEIRRRLRAQPLPEETKAD